MSEHNCLPRHDEPDGLISYAIATTAQRLGITTTRDDWSYRGGDDSSKDHPYVEHHLVPGRLWLRVTGGLYDENRQPVVWSRIWCPQVLGADASVPMERFALDGLQMLIGDLTDAKSATPNVGSTAPKGSTVPTAARLDAGSPFRERIREKWRLVSAVLIFLVALVLAGAFLSRDALSNRRPVATSAPAMTGRAPSATSAPTQTSGSTAGGKAGTKGEGSTRAATEAKNKGSSASFAHFLVTVTRISRNASELRVQARVCVRSLPADPQGDRTRISWDPWSIRTGSGTIEPDVHAAQIEDEFPSDATYRVGQCASGWIPFATNRTANRIVYSNGVGDRAVWDATDIAAKPTVRSG